MYINISNQLTHQSYPIKSFLQLDAITLENSSFTMTISDDDPDSDNDSANDEDNSLYEIKEQDINNIINDTHKMDALNRIDVLELKDWDIDDNDGLVLQKKLIALLTNLTSVSSLICQSENTDDLSEEEFLILFKQMLSLLSALKHESITILDLNMGRLELLPFEGSIERSIELENAIVEFNKFIGKCINLEHLDFEADYMDNIYFDHLLTEVLAKHSNLNSLYFSMAGVHLPTIACLFSNESIQDMRLSFKNKITENILKEYQLHTNPTINRYTLQYHSFEEDLYFFSKSIQNNRVLKKLTLNFVSTWVEDESGREIYRKKYTKNPLLPISHNKTLEKLCINIPFLAYQHDWPLFIANFKTSWLNELRILTDGYPNWDILCYARSQLTNEESQCLDNFLSIYDMRLGVHNIDRLELSTSQNQNIEIDPNNHRNWVYHDKSISDLKAKLKDPQYEFTGAENLANKLICLQDMIHSVVTHNKNIQQDLDLHKKQLTLDSDSVILSKLIKRTRGSILEFTPVSRLIEFDSILFNSLLTELSRVHNTSNGSVWFKALCEIMFNRSPLIKSENISILIVPFLTHRDMTRLYLATGGLFYNKRLAAASKSPIIEENKNVQKIIENEDETQPSKKFRSSNIA